MLILTARKKFLPVASVAFEESQRVRIIRPKMNLKHSSSGTRAGFYYTNW